MLKDPSSSSVVATVEIAVARLAGGTSVNVSIMTDSAGQPDTVLETLAIGPYSATPSIQLANSVVHPLLTAGTKYWLVVTPINSGDEFIWCRNITLPSAPDAQRHDAGSWRLSSDYQGTMRLTGDPPGPAVPTLSGWALSLLALMLVAISVGMLRGRRLTGN